MSGVLYGSVEWCNELSPIDDSLIADILVVGGGLVGLTLAISAAQSGFRVVVIDRDTPENSTGAEFDGRVSSVAAGSANLFKALGLWGMVSSEAQPIYQIRVSDGEAPRFLHYDSDDLGGEPMGYIVENRILRCALYLAAKREERITLKNGTFLEKLETDAFRVSALFSDGTFVRAPLVIAADGRVSSVRACVGIGTTYKDYGQMGIVCTVTHELDHEGIAHERFLRGGPFAILPMRGKRSSLVWTERTELARELLKVKAEIFLDELRWRLGDFLGDLGLAGRVWSYPLSLTMAKDLVAQRTALVGDAAHAIHPIAGQGLNLGLRDAAVLVEVIADARRLGLDIGDQGTLSRYSRWRRFDALTMAAVTDGLNRLFAHDSEVFRVMRNVGLTAVNSNRPLKALFRKHAMGLLGKLPKLLEGEPS